MKPVHFDSAADFRRWLEKNHASAPELWVAFYKKTSGKSGMSYAEAVEEALCFGWIDGIIKRLDERRYTHRFSPRKVTSIWSRINVAKAERLIADRKMHEAGLKAFAARSAAKTGIYSFEAREAAKFSPALVRRFRAHPTAWKFFAAQPPGYQRIMTFVVMSAKQEATRERRLDRLIAASEAGRRLEAIPSKPASRAS
jgi:uncharacterized protein YdeI (YjbR/CyaY-like superfamily)